MWQPVAPYCPEPQPRHTQVFSSFHLAAHPSVMVGEGFL